VPNKWLSAKIPLPKTALGKVFAEGHIAFAEGLRPSAKILSEVVRQGQHSRLISDRSKFGSKSWFQTCNDW